MRKEPKATAGNQAKPSPPKPKELALSIQRKGKESPAEPLPPDLVNWLHQLLMDVAPYMAQVQVPGHDSSHDPRTDPQVTAQTYVGNYLKEMKPRNPAERMLAIQMLWQHARISRLSQLPFQTGLDALKGINAAIDSAMNVYRRQASTYQDLRTPRPVQFIKGEQVNVADQQVVAGGPSSDSEKKSVSNEQGSTNGKRSPALLPESLGIEIPAFLGKAKQTVGEVHRPSKSGGQGEIST